MSKKPFFILAFIFLLLVMGGSFILGTLKKEETSPQKKISATVVSDNLEIPWSLAFLPDGSILFTERPGRVRMIRKGNLLSSPVATISSVLHIGEGGLLGIAISPNFENNKNIFLYYTYSSAQGSTLNRIVRYTFEKDKLMDEKIIVDAIPGASNHNGGRIKFGPDKFLYITTGDAQNPSKAQDKKSLAGKILRVTEEGKAAPGNPFGNLVYSYGHRNSQGLAWDSKGRLWATEHGASAHDELNIIEAGKNYEWPDGVGNSLINSGLTTWAPAGAAYYQDSIFFVGLRGNALYEVNIGNNELALKEHLKGEFGRLRDIVVGPDRFLYLLTSNRDGRGLPRQGDDKIIKINAKTF